MSSKINRYKKEFFEKIVKRSINLKDVARNLGIGTTYGNRKTIKKYIDLYGIDIKHFYVPTSTEFKNKRELVDILISGSTYLNTTHLKERLYKDKIKERKCEECGQNEKWKGKKISLILDHKNGINNDNRIENLRILCPNCDAAQETFCRGFKRKKIKVRKHSNDFYSKRSLDQRKVQRPTYQELKKEIMELGYLGTGRKYNVSDNAIRKWERFYKKHK